MRLISVVAFALVLAACSDGSTTAVPAIPGQPSMLRLAQPNLSTQHLYVLNVDLHSITVYPTTATGNHLPKRTIAGSSTQLSSCFPNQIAVDKLGELFVSCQRVGSTWGILVFAPLANGNVAPARTITGSATGLDFPYGVATDKNNNLFVSNCGNQCSGSGLPPSITVYAAGASGNVAPIRAISGSATAMACTFPCPMGVDHTGKAYVFNTSFSTGNYTVYAATANGNAAPLRTVTDKRQQGGNLSTSSIAFDSLNDMFTVTYLNGAVEVDKFNAGARGKISPAGILAGALTQLVQSQSIAFDNTDRPFVGNCGPCGGGSVEDVTVYAAGATGNVAPVAVLSGSNTGLGAIQSIAIGK